MSDENVGGLVELPPLPDIGPEGWYTRADMIAYARAALSAHGGLLFTQADMERFGLHVADAREERLKSAHGQPVVDEDVAEEGGFFHLDDLAKAIEKLGWRTSDFEALTAALTGATP